MSRKVAGKVPGMEVFYMFDKKIDWNKFDNGNITYYQWIKTKVNVVVKGKTKVCQKTIKKKINSTKHEMVSNFEKQLLHFMQHVANINHQYQIISHIK